MSPPGYNPRTGSECAEIDEEAAKRIEEAAKRIRFTSSSWDYYYYYDNVEWEEDDAAAGGGSWRAREAPPDHVRYRALTLAAKHSRTLGLIYSTLCPIFWVLWCLFFMYIDPPKCTPVEYASTNNITGEVNRGGSKERCRSNGVFYGCFVGLFCAMATWLVFYALSFFVFICYIYIQIKSELPQSLTLLRTGRMGIFCSMLQDTRLRDEGLPVYPPCICMPICLCVYFHTKIYNRENICDTQSMEDKAFDWCCPDPKDPPTMADRCRYYLLPPEWCRYYLLLFFYLPYYIYVFIMFVIMFVIMHSVAFILNCVCCSGGSGSGGGGGGCGGGGCGGGCGG